ncbi:apolipoprotein A-IV [Paralichthys olivaceus]|uniref:apolipoprotein A-IV n=1 Tax=Paralichthys olivaceus TaxID=8255 RepID=UPI003752163D
MHRKAVIFTLSFLTISAYPLHRDTREATLTDSKSNQAHDKTNLTKDVDNLYKSHLDSSSLYNQEDDHNTNPMAEEMQRKLIMESERLRTRLRQELAELQERLSPSPAHLSSPLASMRELLAPLTQQLHSSISSNTEELCGQLSLYLQDLDTADAQTEASSADRHQEAFHLMTQALDRSSSKLANVITDLHSKTAEVIGRFTEITANEEDAARSDVWQVLSSRLGQEASSLRVETQIMVGALKEELAALLETSEPSRAEVTASVERFCQKAASVSQVFQIQMEKLFQELEEQRSSSLSPSSSSSSSSSSTHPAGSLQEDFSVKLSALIHDIVHSVVTDP